MLPEASHQVFAQTNIWVGRDVVQRTTIWLLSSWSSFISEWNDLFILSLHVVDAFRQVSAQENIWVGRSCLKNSKKAV